MLEDGFADIIAKARFGKGWSLSDLARRSKFEEARISCLEKESRPSKSEVVSLASLLGLDANKLQAISDCSWEPGLRPPYIPEQMKTNPSDMIHVIEGKIGNYPVNGYLFVDWPRGECVLFDTGYSPDKVIAFLEEHGLRLVAICLTHAHPDHIGGIETIQAHHQVPVYLHRDEAPEKIVLEHRIFVEEKCRITLGDFIITARMTPGHTDGGTSYFIDFLPGMKPSIAFVGDALFAGSIGRAKATETYQTLLNSVKTVILSFPPRTMLFPGHGPVTTVDEENEHNPFFA
jgi:hydroxyacylglutathione hydrolase